MPSAGPELVAIFSSHSLIGGESWTPMILQPNGSVGVSDSGIGLRWCRAVGTVTGTPNVAKDMSGESYLAFLGH